MANDETIESIAAAICNSWGYNWDGDENDDQVAPERADYYDDRPDKQQYRDAARQAIAAYEQSPEMREREEQVKRLVEAASNATPFIGYLPANSAAILDPLYEALEPFTRSKEA